MPKFNMDQPYSDWKRGEKYQDRCDARNACYAIAVLVIAAVIVWERWLV